MKGRAAKPSHEDKLRLEGVTGEIANKAAQEIMAKSPVRTREEDVTDAAAKHVEIAIERFLKQCDIDLKPTTKAQAVESIYKMLREEMRAWPQDDLLIEASFILALTVVNELHDRLI
jgi:hypothetical protein